MPVVRGLIRKRRRLAAALAIVLAWWWSSSIHGYLDAALDVARGHFEVQSTGLPARWRPEYARLLRARHGIELRVVAGCVVSDALTAYVRAYDTLAVAAAKYKFGRDVFAECDADARKHWERRRAAIARTSEGR